MGNPRPAPANPGALIRITIRMRSNQLTEFVPLRMNLIIETYFLIL